MAIASQDFLESAKRLAALPDEVDHRNAVSRSYYATYHPAEELAASLPDHHHMTGKGGMHEKLAKKLSEFPMKMADFTPDECLCIRSIGIVLNRLKTQRRIADYELGYGYSAKDAVALVAAAERLLKRIDDFTDSRARAASATA